MSLRNRVAAQLLHRPDGLDAGDVVRHLLAVQAQDLTSAHLAFRARSATLTVAEIEAAQASGEIVRTWGPRGTLHLMAVEDLPWLLSLTARRTGTLRRLAEEGVTAADPLALIRGALEGQGPLTKAQLEERLGIKGQGIVHLVALAASHGLAVLGPSRQGKPTYVWLDAPIAFEKDRDRALAELAVRYRRAHADSTPEDLAAWSGLALGECRKAWPGSAAHDEATVPLRLLPAFDEYLMGWKSRDPILPREHARKVFPGGGMLRAVVLTDGMVAGTWTRGGGPESFGEPLDLTEELDDVRRFLQVATSG